MARDRLVGDRVPPCAASGSPAPRARAVVRRASGAGGGPRQQQPKQRRPGPGALPGRPRHRYARIRSQAARAAAGAPGRGARSAPPLPPDATDPARSRAAARASRLPASVCASSIQLEPSRFLLVSSPPRWSSFLAASFCVLSSILPSDPAFLQESPTDIDLAGLGPCYSECGPRTSSISIPRKLVSITNVRPHRRPINQDLHLTRFSRRPQYMPKFKKRSSREFNLNTPCQNCWSPPATPNPNLAPLLFCFI